MDTNTQASEQKFFAFYSRVPNSTFIFPNGVSAVFTGGRFTTQDETQANHLYWEIKQGNQHIFINEQKLTLVESELDPMAELKARIIAEYLAKEGLKTTESTSEQGKLNVADTASIGAAAADSSSEGSAATVVPGVKLSLSK